ncbi:MAG: type IV secretory system conjugative DNA transfer family protein [Thermoanaerobaculia bacterium]
MPGRIGYRLAEPYLRIEDRGTARGEYRWSASFAIELKFCPQEREDPSQPLRGFLRRQSDQRGLIDALHSIEPAPRTFALRYSARPRASGVAAGGVDIFVLGKTEAPESEMARTSGLSFCGEMTSQLSSVWPDHGWSVVTEEHRFLDAWGPISWDKAYFAEICRREGFVNLLTARPPEVSGFGRDGSGAPSVFEDSVYFVHRLIPRPGANERILRRLLLHGVPVTLTISLTPTSIDPNEEETLGSEVSMCEEASQGRGPQAPNEPSRPHALYQRQAESLCESLHEQLLRLQDAPFLMQMTLASEEPIPRTLVEAVGVEITAPVGGDDPSERGVAMLQRGGYDVIDAASDEDRARLGRAARRLEFAPCEGSLAPASLRRLRYLVDAAEAVSAFRFPVATDAGLVGVEVRRARVRPLPREVAAVADLEESKKATLLGENHFLGHPQAVFLPEADRFQHLYVVGQTGTGKTTFLKSMIAGDILAGRGVAVIDPHGDLFREILNLVPPGRKDDVVVIDPTDQSHPVGLNLLECSTEDERYFIVREMHSIMERLIEDQYGGAAHKMTGPVFYQHMQMNMLLAMSNPENPGTLYQFFEIFQQKDFWKRWLPLKWSDPQLVRWVESNLPAIDYGARSGPGEMSYGEYLGSKFVDFVFDPKLRRIFGQQRSTIDFRQIMDEGKILLVNLAKGQLAESNSRFLGMVLMARLQAAALGRPEGKRRPFFVYIDEFQSMATQTFISLLSEARKFGLHLVLANQFASQIRDERIVQSIFGNVGTLVSFRVGHEDAAVLENQFSPYFDRTDLVNLPNWEACVKTTIRGQAVAPFNFRTVVSAPTPDPAAAGKIVAASAARYGRPRAEVDAEIQESLRMPEGS